MVLKNRDWCVLRPTTEGCGNHISYPEQRSITPISFTIGVVGRYREQRLGGPHCATNYYTCPTDTLSPLCASIMTGRHELFKTLLEAGSCSCAPACLGVHAHVCAVTGRQVPQWPQDCKPSTATNASPLARLFPLGKSNLGAAWRLTLELALVVVFVPMKAPSLTWPTVPTHYLFSAMANPVTAHPGPCCVMELILWPWQDSCANGGTGNGLRHTFTDLVAQCRVSWHTKLTQRSSL